MASPHNTDHHDYELIDQFALPQTFGLSLDASELVRVVEWAGRFSPSPPASFQLLCCFQAGGRRRWVVEEANVWSWLDVTDDSQPVLGAVQVPFHILKSALEVNPSDDPVAFLCDIAAEKITITIDGMTISCDLPALPEVIPAFDEHFDTSMRIGCIELGVAGGALRALPITPELVEHDIAWPFVTVQFESGLARFGCDGSQFDGETIEACVDANGDHEGCIKFYGPVVLREMWFATEMGGATVRFEFSERSPDVIIMRGVDWGMRVALGAEIVLRYRVDIENTLEEAGIRVERDHRIGWNPVIVASVGERDVTIELITADRFGESHARLSTVVADEVSWNPEIASEINLWNDKWFETTLIYRRGCLVVQRDVSVHSLETLPAAVLDLVDKSLNVYDVVGVFM